MDYLVTMDTGERYLAHHGVKGMKWGKWNPETAARYAGGKVKGAVNTTKDKISNMSPETKQKLKTAGKIAAVGVGTAAAIYGGSKAINKFGGSKTAEDLLSKKYKLDALHRESDKSASDYLADIKRRQSRGDSSISFQTSENRALYEKMASDLEKYSNARKKVDSNLTSMKKLGTKGIGKASGLIGGAAAGGGYLGKKMVDSKIKEAKTKSEQKRQEKARKRETERAEYNNELYEAYSNDPDYGKAVRKHISVDSKGNMTFSKEFERAVGAKGSDWDDIEYAFISAIEYENGKKRR